MFGYIPHTDFGLNHASHASQKKKTEEKHNVFWFGNYTIFGFSLFLFSKANSFPIPTYISETLV